MRVLHFAIIGAGFWSRFQLAAWRELPGARCVAVCDSKGEKAELLAREFGIKGVYDDAATLFSAESLDFVDIIAGVEAHQPLVELAAKHRIAAICQKPMAPTPEAARSMVQTCDEAENPFFIHENWRFQTPLRELKTVLENGEIGEVFRARLSFNTSFPVFDNQPVLRELDEFILCDIGSHVLDSARFLFGEAQSLFCQTHRINDIKGEDVASVQMKMGGATVLCEMSYASRTRAERFPQTFAFVEGTRGSVELSTDYWLHITTESGTHGRRIAPPRYAWADPAYDVVHASIVPCNRDILGALRGEHAAETTGRDNLQTVELVFAAYQSARENRVVTF